MHRIYSKNAENCLSSRTLVSFLTQSSHRLSAPIVWTYPLLFIRFEGVVGVIRRRWWEWRRKRCVVVTATFKIISIDNIKYSIEYFNKKGWISCMINRSLSSIFRRLWWSHHPCRRRSIQRFQQRRWGMSRYLWFGHGRYGGWICVCKFGLYRLIFVVFCVWMTKRLVMYSFPSFCEWVPAESWMRRHGRCEYSIEHIHHYWKQWTTPFRSLQFLCCGVWKNRSGLWVGVGTISVLIRKFKCGKLSRNQ